VVVSAVDREVGVSITVGMLAAAISALVRAAGNMAVWDAEVQVAHQPLVEINANLLAQLEPTPAHHLALQR